MQKTLIYLLGATALISLSACNRGGTGSAPTGQVVAKVGGDEITQRELSAELNGFSSRDENETKRAQEAAVNAIVNRKLLVDAAEKAGIDKSPEYQLLMHRSEELMLARAYQQQLASKLPKPSEQEVNQYMAQYPNTFAERKIYMVDQIKMPRNTDPKVLERLKPLRSMDDIEQALLSASVDYAREPATIDARSTAPALIDQIAKVGSEPFVIPVRDVVTINQVKEARTVPFTGKSATELATRAIMADRAGKALQAKMEELRKAAGPVQYQPGYAPKPSGDQAKDQAKQS